LEVQPARVADFDNHLLTAGAATWTTSLLPGGSYNVTAHYPGDGNFAASDSATSVPVVVNKETGHIAAALVTTDAKGNVINGSATTAAYGSPYLLRVGVTGTTCSTNSVNQAGCPTGSVTLSDNGSPLDAGSYALNRLGFAEDDFIQLSGGSHTVSASYAGDNSFNATSTSTAITISPAFTTLSAPTGLSAQVGTEFQSNVTLQTSSSGVAPTGTMTFYLNGAVMNGTVSFSAAAGNTTQSAVAYASIDNLATAFPTSGTYTLNSVYGGDSNYSAATSPTITLQVKHPGSDT